MPHADAERQREKSALRMGHSMLTHRQTQWMCRWCALASFSAVALACFLFTWRGRASSSFIDLTLSDRIWLAVGTLWVTTVLLGFAAAVGQALLSAYLDVVSRRQIANRCTVCAYPSAGGVCPECGNDRSAPAKSGDNARLANRLARILIIAALGGWALGTASGEGIAAFELFVHSVEDTGPRPPFAIRRWWPNDDVVIAGDGFGRLEVKVED